MKSKPKRRTPRSQPVQHVQLDPRVLATAKRLAGGDLRRIKVLGKTEALVVNPSADI